MAVRLRTRMHGIVLRTGMGLPYRTVVQPLQTADYGHSETTGEIRIFTVCLHTATPARVPEYIDVRSPESQSLIDSDRLAAVDGHLVLDPGLVADSCEDFIYKFVIERSRHSDSLRKNSRRTVSGDAVESFVPPVILLDTQSFYSCRRVHHQRCFFFDSESGDKIVRPFFRRKAAIQIRLSRCHH